MSAFFVKNVFLFSVFVRYTITINEIISFTDYVCGIRLPDCSKLDVNWKNSSDVTICWYHVIANFFEVLLFLFSSLVSGTNFMSLLSLVLELWQFLFIRDSQEILKSEIPPPDFCPIYGDWGKLRTLNVARTSLIKCYWMLQNSRVTAFTVFELLRENQQKGEEYTHLMKNIFRNNRKEMMGLAQSETLKNG